MTGDHPVAARGRGFTAETLAGLLAAGVAPRHLRRLLCTHAGEDDWRAAPLIDGEDPVWRHVAPIPHGADHALVWGRPGYPVVFEALQTPPPVVFVDGPMNAIAPAVAVVGSRDMSELGRIVATVAASTAADLGAPVVSGAARGVDTTAFDVALERGATCLAFVGSGLAAGSPEQRSLRDRITAAGGAVVSELPPDMAASPGTLLARNRLIAACAAPLVVCEAAPRSGTTACAGDAVLLDRPIVVPVPRTGHHRLPGAQGLTALAGRGGDAGKRLGWSQEALARVVHRERIANAACETRDDLTVAISVFWWLHGSAQVAAPTTGEKG